MSDIFFSKFDSEYFSLIIFLKYLFILLLIMISFIIMTLLEKNKICRTFRAVGYLGTLQTFSDTAITDRHSDTTIFQLRAHWVRISWSIGSEKWFGHVPPVGVDPSTSCVQGSTLSTRPGSPYTIYGKFLLLYSVTSLTTE